MRLYLTTILLLSNIIFAGDLEEMYSPEIKAIKSEDFVSKFSKFSWGGVNKRIAMSTSSALFKHKVRESIAYFNADGKFLRLDAWIYNRGDDGSKSEEEFEKYYNEILEELNTHFKSKPSKSNISGSTRSTAYTYTLPGNTQVSLLVGFEKKPFRSDFIALVMRNIDKNDRVRGSAEAKKFVITKENGDVIIDKIPMIDQGPKGYCVPATLARIGQHYGVDISMHEIAMIADSSSGGGTSVQAAVSSMKQNYARIKLKIKDINVKTPGVFKRSGNTLVPISAAEAKEIHDKIKDDDASLAKFRNEIIANVDKGLIIAWTMVVGLLPENGQPVRQNGGGHMRMIIGYNKKTDEVIFSDSWGNGHEIKRITTKAAFVVTSDIYEIIP